MKKESGMSSTGVNGGSLPKPYAATLRFKELFSFFANHLAADCFMQKEGKLVRL
jgi:hypothetical protein